MAKVSKTWGSFNSIHANAWTETLAGLIYLIDQVEHLENTGDSVNKIYLTRLAIISSSYLAEQVFAQASRQYVDKVLAGDTKESTCQLTKRILMEWKDRNSIQKVGVSRAIEEWPKVLTGAPLILGENPLQSLKIVMNYNRGTPYLFLFCLVFSFVIFWHKPSQMAMK